MRYTYWRNELFACLPVVLPAGVADMRLLAEALVFYSVLVLCLISQM